nr:immunoglobulin light chain junction region [Macaca mulatta]
DYYCGTWDAGLSTGLF